MGTRVQWTGTIPAGSDASKNFVIGAVPEGKRLIVAGASFYGGDSGERYTINLIPASQAVENATINADTGGICWAYPMSGGTQTVNTPVPVTQYFPGMLCPIPGPVTIAVGSVTATAAVFAVNMLGILEDL